MTGKHHNLETRLKISKSMRGKNTWIKGTKLSEAHKKKLGIAHLGSIPWNKGKTGYLSKEASDKIRQAHYGNKYNWKGGKVILKERLRGLEEYKEWRFKIFTRDSFICQECFIPHKDIEVHHNIKPLHIIIANFLAQYNQFSPIDDMPILLRLAITYQPFWDIDNGKTLCIDCHNLTLDGSHCRRKT
jgi:hypothetical protein